MNYERNYYQILTNNNGDSIVEIIERDLAFQTEDFVDGTYRLFVEAWDEYGNMAIDSQDVVFNNGIIGLEELRVAGCGLQVFPNPSSGTMRLLVTRNLSRAKPRGESRVTSIDLYEISGMKIKELINEVKMPGEYEMEVDLRDFAPGVYLIRFTVGNQTGIRKLVKNK